MLKNSIVKIQGDNNEEILKAESYISGIDLWVEDNQCVLSVGERSFVGHHSHLACTENCSALMVGNDCILSSYVQILTGDSHSILDIGQRPFLHHSPAMLSQKQIVFHYGRNA